LGAPRQEGKARLKSGKRYLLETGIGMLSRGGKGNWNSGRCACGIRTKTKKRQFPLISSHETHSCEGKRGWYTGDATPEKVRGGKTDVQGEFTYIAALVEREKERGAHSG